MKLFNQNNSIFKNIHITNSEKYNWRRIVSVFFFQVDVDDLTKSLPEAVFISKIFIVQQLKNYSVLLRNLFFYFCVTNIMSVVSILIYMYPLTPTSYFCNISFKNKPTFPSTLRSTYSFLSVRISNQNFNFFFFCQA